MSTVPWLLTAACLPLGYLVLASISPKRRSAAQTEHLPSALIPSYTTHARLLPVPSKHAFSYPLIYLGVDIDALEAGTLDIPARLFAYGGQPWTKVLGLRSLNYLTPGPDSLRHKLDKLLADHGMDKSQVGRAWMVSMPSLLGFEGINPLTVWYIYDSRQSLSCLVLEVHNTFGEKHAYILQVGSEHQVEPNADYHYAWVFPRTFHVSPFNSRNGFYRLDIIDPFPRDRTVTADDVQHKVFLRLLTQDKTTKLTAVVGSHPVHRPVPLEAERLFSLAWAVARWPFTLFLTLPRVLYNAYILQYLKKLAMFPRPEPRAPGQEGVWNPPQNYGDRLGTAIGWQEIGSSEKWLRQILLPWMEGRVRETGTGLRIAFRDHRDDIDLAGSSDKDLVIATSDPSFFTNLFTSPTPLHFVTLSPAVLTDVSDAASFTRLFSPSTTRRLDRIERLLHNARHRYFAWFISYSTLPCPPDLWVYDSTHWTSDLPTPTRLWLVWTTYMAFFASWAEERVMRLVSAKFVDGAEPWRVWERALKRIYVQAREADAKDALDDNEGWEDLGSMQYR